ncbi:MAG: hypothetical protein Rpha_0422 [Candidatus Ruthia sp. Apha_13_S6]|nr:hypothetical protein [Candidatus Ruthia sp. Apha_13_S6]
MINKYAPNNVKNDFLSGLTMALALVLERGNDFCTGYSRSPFGGFVHRLYGWCNYFNIIGSLAQE